MDGDDLLFLAARRSWSRAQIGGRHDDHCLVMLAEGVGGLIGDDERVDKEHEHNNTAEEADLAQSDI